MSFPWPEAGARIEEVPTPMPVIDEERLARNIARAQGYLDQHGIAFRPHRSEPWIDQVWLTDPRFWSLPSDPDSAHADAATRKLAERAHPLGWLDKPYTGGQLVATVRECLGSLKPSSPESSPPQSSRALH